MNDPYRYLKIGIPPKIGKIPCLFFLWLRLVLLSFLSSWRKDARKGNQKSRNWEREKEKQRCSCSLNHHFKVNSSLEKHFCVLALKASHLFDSSDFILKTGTSLKMADLMTTIAFQVAGWMRRDRRNQSSINERFKSVLTIWSNLRAGILSSDRSTPGFPDRSINS